MLRQACLLLSLALPCAAQDLEGRPITGESLGGFVLPVLPVDSGVTLRAVRAWRWSVDDTQRLLLTGDVRVSLGAYLFAADRAVVWIDRIPSKEYGVITQVAIYFPSVDEPTRRAGLGASGRNLLVTGSALKEVRLDAVLVEESPGPDRQLLDAAEARLSAYLLEISGGNATLASMPRTDRAPTPTERPLGVGTPVAEAAAGVVLPAESVAGRVPSPIFRPGGILTFHGGEVELDQEQHLVTVLGGATVDYRAIGSAGGDLQLRAERAVVFLVPEKADAIGSATGSMDSSAVQGVYLEGGVVATDFDYTLRAGRAYYDIQANRAIILDGVLRTTMRDGLPVVARASELRQLSQEQWTATAARVSTSEFFTPHLSVGAERVTITKEPDDDTYVDAESVTVRAGRVPLLWLPRAAGTPGRLPLRNLSVGYSDYPGVIVKDEWDLMYLLGMPDDPDLDVALLNEVYSKNGVGLGARIRGARDGSAMLEGMGFYDFGNKEQTAAGGVVTPSKGARGYLLGEYTYDFSQGLELQAQASYFSDNTFASVFRQNDYANRREYETSAALLASSGNSAFTILGKFNPNDFLSNSSMLASRPYSVDKLPEVTYARYGDSLFGGTTTWSSEYGLDLIRLKVTSGSPTELGIKNRAFFPNNTNQDIPTAYAAAGYDDNFRLRVSTRQELSIPIAFKGGTLTPFASGTFAGYALKGFEDYGNGANSFRVLLAGGLRGNAKFSASYDGVQVPSLDINRLRHIFEPYTTLWYGWDSGSPLNQPVYDQEIEAISGAAAAQFGLTQRLQTMRGGPGAWRSVDWLVADAGVVVDSRKDAYQVQGASQVDQLHYSQGPAPHFYSWRPEYSQWGNHAYANVAFQLTDALSLYGQGTYLFSDNRGNSLNSFGLTDLSRGTVGMRIQQSPDMSFFTEYRYINTFDPTGGYPADEFLQGGFSYQLTKKYSFTFAPQWDLIANQFRAVSGTLTRTFPDFDLTASAGYNAITEEYSLGVAVRLAASERGQAARRRLSSDPGYPDF